MRGKILERPVVEFEAVYSGKFVCVVGAESGIPDESRSSNHDVVSAYDLAFTLERGEYLAVCFCFSFTKRRNTKV